MSCFDSERAVREQQRQRSEEIDLLLREDIKKYKSTHRILCLGSSKPETTIFIKQMKMLHSDGYSKTERLQMADDIRATIKHIIKTVITQMNQFDPPIFLANDENIPKLQYIQEHIFTMPEHDTNFPEIFYEYCDVLWQDDGVKQCFTRSAEYQLIDSAGYFMESSKLSQVAQRDYIPSDDDILKTLYKREGVYVTEFTVERVHFQFLDIGKQNTHKRKWLQCFSDVTAILFIVDVSGYNIIGTDDKSQLHESLAFFETILHDRCLRTVSIILFFNKMDIFRTKIEDSKNPIQDYFPEFQTYSAPPMEMSLALGESSEFSRAKFFVRDIFLRSFDTWHGAEDRMRFCYPHFIVTVDTDSIRKVFDTSRDIIQRTHLGRYRLL